MTVAQNSVEDILAGFRSPESAVKGISGVVAQHPILAASNNLVLAEQNLSEARERVETLERELANAKDVLETSSDLFSQYKTKLAELLK